MAVKLKMMCRRVQLDTNVHRIHLNNHPRHADDVIADRYMVEVCTWLESGMEVEQLLELRGPQRTT